MRHQRGHGTRRVWAPAFLLGLFAAIILGRLVQIQVLEHDQYAQQARLELTGDLTSYARRGSLLDRNGNVLAMSVTAWDVSVSSRAWKTDAVAVPASEALARFLQTSPATLRDAVRHGDSVDVIVRRNLDYETGRQIAAERIAGVFLVETSKRVNPDGDLAASILGVTGYGGQGLAGLESSYNDALQGVPGKTVYERDTTGEPIPFGKYVAVAPKPGDDLVLTIDRTLQQMAESRLDAAIQEHKAKGGTILVLDPATGEILALASRPGLKYSTLNLEDPKQLSLLNNPSITSVYEPGSVMKIVTASAAIDQGVVTPDTTYVDTGVVYIYETPIYNWDHSTYGLQSMTGVLQNSINTGAIFMVQKLGATTFHKYLDAFGFGKPTGVDFPGEAGGIIRRPWDKDWSPVDLATQSFGQSISVTPLQMLTAIGAAINGGKLVRPHFIKAHIGADGVRTEVEPVVEGQAIKPETSATMRWMLGQVISQDPAGVGRNPKLYTAGGKSGTANVPVWNGYNDTQIASFVGFAPLDNPRILVLVKLDQNEDYLTGTAAAGPVFRMFADDALQYLGVKPDKVAK